MVHKWLNKCLGRPYAIAILERCEYLRKTAPDGNSSQVKQWRSVMTRRSDSRHHESEQHQHRCLEWLLYYYWCKAGISFTWLLCDCMYSETALASSLLDTNTLILSSRVPSLSSTVVFCSLGILETINLQHWQKITDQKSAERSQKLCVWPPWTTRRRKSPQQLSQAGMKAVHVFGFLFGTKWTALEKSISGKSCDITRQQLKIQSPDQWQKVDKNHNATVVTSESGCSWVLKWWCRND